MPSTPRRRSALLWALPVVAVLGTLGITAWLLHRADYFWASPIAGVHFQLLTDFDGTERAAALSRDGRLVAFLSDCEGQTDVWMTQLGTGEFHNLTHGSVRELVNPSVRSIGFSPDGAFVTFWTREAATSEIAIWAVPTLGGEPRPYLEGAAEFDWSSDGSRLVYHSPAPGDPMFVSQRGSHPATARSSRPRPGSTLTFPCGRRTTPSSTSSRARCPTPWTSGAFVQREESRNG